MLHTWRFVFYLWVASFFFFVSIFIILVYLLKRTIPTYGAVTFICSAFQDFPTSISSLSTVNTVSGSIQTGVRFYFVMLLLQLMLLGTLVTRADMVQFCFVHFYIQPLPNYGGRGEEEG